MKLQIQIQKSKAKKKKSKINLQKRKMQTLIKLNSVKQKYFKQKLYETAKIMEFE